jgi:uncharacterized protein YjeT (DUF2065 family)
MQADNQVIVSDNLKLIRKLIKFPIMLFGVMVTIFGIISFLIYFNVEKVAGDEVNWLATEAEVVAAEVKTSVHTDRKYDERTKKYTTRSTSSFAPEITFKYTVAGKEYTGRKFRTLGFSSSRENEIKELIAGYPAGRRITVYYNPAKNEEAVIEKAPAPSKMLLVFGGGVVLLGLVIVFVLSRIAAMLFDIITSSVSGVGIKPGN